MSDRANSESHSESEGAQGAYTGWAQLQAEMSTGSESGADGSNINTQDGGNIRTLNINTDIATNSTPVKSVAAEILAEQREKHRIREEKQQSSNKSSPQNSSKFSPQIVGTDHLPISPQTVTNYSPQTVSNYSPTAATNTNNSPPSSSGKEWNSNSLKKKWKDMALSRRQEIEASNIDSSNLYTYYWVTNRRKAWWCMDEVRWNLEQRQMEMDEINKLLEEIEQRGNETGDKIHKKESGKEGKGAKVQKESEKGDDKEGKNEGDSVRPSSSATSSSAAPATNGESKTEHTKESKEGVPSSSESPSSFPSSFPSSSSSALPSSLASAFPSSIAAATPASAAKDESENESKNESKNKSKPNLSKNESQKYNRHNRLKMELESLTKEWPLLDLHKGHYIGGHVFVGRTSRAATSLVHGKGHDYVLVFTTDSSANPHKKYPDTHCTIQKKNSILSVDFQHDADLQDYLADKAYLDYLPNEGDDDRKETASYYEQWDEDRKATAFYYEQWDGGPVDQHGNKIRDHQCTGRGPTVVRGNLVDWRGNTMRRRALSGRAVGEMAAAFHKPATGDDANKAW